MLEEAAARTNQTIREIIIAITTAHKKALPLSTSPVGLPAGSVCCTQVGLTAHRINQIMITRTMKTIIAQAQL